MMGPAKTMTPWIVPALVVAIARTLSAVREQAKILIEFETLRN
jgi:hypothetical protein